MFLDEFVFRIWMKVYLTDPTVHSGSARGEFGGDGESDTQTVPSMDGESGASAASGDDPRGRCGQRGT